MSRRRAKDLKQHLKIHQPSFCSSSRSHRMKMQSPEPVDEERSPPSERQGQGSSPGKRERRKNPTRLRKGSSRSCGECAGTAPRGVRGAGCGARDAPLGTEGHHGTPRDIEGHQRTLRGTKGHRGTPRGIKGHHGAVPEALPNPPGPGRLNLALNPALYALTRPRGALITAQQMTRHANDAGDLCRDDIFPVDGITYSAASRR